MRRRVPPLVVAFVIVAGLVSGCIPRRPPHIPQPVAEVHTKQISPVDQHQRITS